MTIPLRPSSPVDHRANVLDGAERWNGVATHVAPLGPMAANGSPKVWMRDVSLSYGAAI